MRTLHQNFNPTPVWAAALCLTLAACLSGCASTNPVTDEPEKSTKQTDEPSVAANTGVQKTESRRFLGILSPYRPDVQQGNFASQEMVAQLKEGMTQDQVRFLLGTPLLTDIFHADRWDYLFRLQKGNGEILSSHVTVFFTEGRVARFEGGDLPSEKDFLKLIVGESGSVEESL